MKLLPESKQNKIKAKNKQNLLLKVKTKMRFKFFVQTQLALMPNDVIQEDHKKF